MSSIQIEFATVIYADKLREAEHNSLVKKALAGRRKHVRNPIQALGKLISRLVKQKQAYRVAAEETSAVLTDAGL